MNQRLPTHPNAFMNSNTQPPAQSPFAQSPFTQSPFAQSPFAQPASNASYISPFSQQPLPKASVPSPFASVESGKFNNSVPKILKERKPRNNKEKDQTSRNPKKPKPYNPHTHPQSGSHQQSAPQNGSKHVGYPIFHSTGFAPKQFTQSNDDAVLKPLPKPLTSFNLMRDDFDVQNQQKLCDRERSYLNGEVDLQTVYSEMNEMREVERVEMEKRGLVDSTVVRKNLKDAIVFIGSCLDMCPVAERIRRANENMALSFEKDKDGRVLPSLAIKAFSRPAAGQPPPLPSDVRPPNILVSTLEYICTNLISKLPSSHAFIWDRTRSIRQDFTYQNYQGPEAVLCFEVIARIHILCLHKMASSNSDLQWSQQQELEQFNKCLQSLAEFYSLESSKNEPEMRAYQLLSNFFDKEIPYSIDLLGSDIRDHVLVKLAYELRALGLNSPTELFKRVRMPDVPLQFRLIMEIHYNKLRVRAMSALCTSTMRKMRWYSILRFQELLGFESLKEARDFISFYSMTTSVNNNVEEVDIKSWDENTVNEKGEMAQSFDESINALVDSMDVLVGAEYSGTKSNERAFNVMATPFNQSAPAPVQTLPSGIFSFDKELKEERQIKQELQTLLQSSTNQNSQQQQQQHELELETQRKQKEEEEKKQEEERKQKQKEKELELELQKQKQREQEQEQELQKKIELEKQKLQLQKQRQEEQERQLYLETQRRMERQKFICQTSSQITSNIITMEVNKYVDQIAKLLVLRKKEHQNSFINKVSKAAQHKIEKLKALKAKKMEYNYFAKPQKRVISERFAFCPKLQRTRTFRHEREDSQSSMSVDFMADSRIDLTLSTDQLIKAYSLGLRNILIDCDFSSPQGVWLRLNKIPNTIINLDDNVRVRIIANSGERSVDADIVLKGMGSNSTAQLGNNCEYTAQLPESCSSEEFTVVLNKVLEEYTASRFKKMTSIKSLAPKRMKTERSFVSRDSSMFNDSMRDDSVDEILSYNREKLVASKIDTLIREANELTNK